MGSTSRCIVTISLSVWLCTASMPPAQATDTGPPEITGLDNIGVSYAAEKNLPNLSDAFIDTKPSSRQDEIAVGELGRDGGERTPIVSFAQEIADGQHGEIDSLLLWANGRLLFESYFRRGRINYP
ncbi:MAG: hydrolase, partial [Gammaproteobacteria bacterium]|nr:hydrolase [Gammaproteobacteria bacterium]